MLSLFRRKQFKKDFKKLIYNPVFDPKELEYVLSKLVTRESLEAKYLNHKLTGEFRGCFECHVQPDVLLIYSVDEKRDTLYLLRIGSHSNLF